MGSPTLADRAIGWYDVAARDLPWRRPGTTPWGVLVSEVMLQQTPVARVTPVWLEWQRRWPTASALAAAAPGEAIRAWGRLGYPRRALRLHACARAIVAEHDARVPHELAALLQLPGVGSYTARAVAVFAFSQRHAVVDTNVRRVVARAVAGQAGGGAATTANDLATVQALLPRSTARAVKASAALMELGALVCSPRQPACPSCPLERVCRWRARGRPPGQVTSRRRSQRYAGTDRQVRGILLATMRDAAGPVSLAAFEAAWPAAEQRERALAGLLTDGLLVAAGPGRFALPR